LSSPDAFGHSEMPAPTSSNCGARSNTSTSIPARRSAVAAASPPMPAPTIRTFIALALLQARPMVKPR
jgi:hypothetical protein